MKSKPKAIAQIPYKTTKLLLVLQKDYLHNLLRTVFECNLEVDLLLNILLYIATADQYQLFFQLQATY
jgi:hypothetical protein